MKLTDEQLMIHDMARDFAQKQLLPNASRWDQTNEFPEAAIKAMGALGFMGMLVPETYGGAGADTLAFAVAIEEIAAGDGSCSTIMSVHNAVVCLPLLHYGSKMQKETFLKPLAQGKNLGAFCLTEPQAGSDAAHIATTAVLDGNTYVLNGVKQFVTSGQHADIALVFAVTDPGQGKKGISAFIVPTTTPGYEVASLEKKLGQKASDTAQIVLKDCRVDADLRLGEAGEGYKIALSHLEVGRISIAAQAVGMARAAFEAAIAYAKERTSFGKPIFAHQAIAFRLADMATQIEAARLLVHQAAQLHDQAQPCLKQAAMAKLFASEMAEKVVSQAMQVFGGYGYLSDFPVERIYRDVRVTQIYEGTSDVQRIVIARELLNND